MAEGKEGPHTNDDHLRAVGLTEIEERIFDDLAAGMTRREICREQGIGHSTYDAYLRMARRYLGVRTTLEAVAVYIRDKAKREEDEEE